MAKNNNEIPKISPRAQYINDLLAGKNVPEPIIDDKTINTVNKNQIPNPSKKVKVYIDPSLRHHFTLDELEALNE